MRHSKLEEAARQACQTPLKDLLRSVPKDGRDCYEEDSTCHHFIPYGRLIHEALSEIERLEALAEQAEQEPVWWHYSINGNWDGFYHEKPDDDVYDEGTLTPLYAAPVRTKDLTDDEIAEIFSKYASDLYKGRAVIAADREKNRG